MTVTLPWPPSVNHYWMRSGHRCYIGKKGIQFRKDVNALCMEYKFTFPLEKRLKVIIDAYPPDKRKRDLDNLFKAIFDSLQTAEVFVDDYQIDEIHISRNKQNLGQLIVKIEDI